MSKGTSVIQRGDQHPAPSVPMQHMPAPANYTFEQIKLMASSFAKSGLFGVKDPDAALSLMLIAQAENKHPALIMRDFDLIGGRLAKKAEAMLADYQASGGTVKWIELTDLRACAIFTHPLSPEPLQIDWDIQRARTAGLAGKDGNMYTKYPRAMLRSRCISEGVRATAPRVTSGFYTPEEVRQIERENPPDAPEPVGLTAAVQQAADKVTKALSEEEIVDLVKTMDMESVSSPEELQKAFATAWKRAKEVGDGAAQMRFKAAYDETREAMKGGGDEDQIV